MKERITITIDEELLQEIDGQIDGTIIKNRSHAIELSLAKAIKQKTVNQAIILAGGKYSVKQDGKNTPSVMVKINNKPILEHNIIALKKRGIDKFILSVGYMADTIKKYFGDGSRLGVNIAYIEDGGEPLGTSGVLRKAAEHITSTFIVCNGDELKDIDVKEMYDYHKKQGTLATIAVTTVSNPQDYGVVVLNGNNVYSFIEKPKGRVPTNLINAGLYIFEPEVVKMAPSGYGRLEEDVFPKLASKENLAGYVFYGKWHDVRDEEGLQEATKIW